MHWTDDLLARLRRDPRAADHAIGHAETPGDALARTALGIVAGLRETAYRGWPRFDPSAGVVIGNCSQLATWLVRSVAPERLKQVPIEPRHRHPRAIMWHEFVAGLARSPASGWDAVPGLHAVRPGDLITWSNLPLRPGIATGHIVIVADTPRESRDGTWHVRVVDSSATVHNEDTRRFPPGGTGAGTLAFRTDGQGRPVAVQFREGFRWNAHPFAIGRIVAP